MQLIYIYSGYTLINEWEERKIKVIYLWGAFCLAPGCMGKRILIKGWGGVARGDRRKVKMIIQDHNRAFLGSQQFHKYKPGTSESWSVLLRHCGFLNQFLLPGTQRHHRLRWTNFLEGDVKTFLLEKPPSPINTARERPLLFKPQPSCLTTAYLLLLPRFLYMWSDFLSFVKQKSHHAFLSTHLTVLQTC